MPPAIPSKPAPPFDLRAVLAASPRESDPLDLLEAYVNPAFAKVLRTIGFDARYVRGEGAYLFDDRGNKYIDCLGGYAVFNLGRNHPVVRDAIRQTLEMDFPSLPGVGTFRTAGLLARELLKVAPGANGEEPGPLDNVFFCNSGTEAIEAAIKHARAATDRDRILYCARGYHGLTLGALSVNGNAEFREPFGALLPHTTEIPFNDLAALERELSRQDVAAFVVEPIQGKGVNIPSDEYLPGALRLCHKHGALLIADEVQTGLGRTGRMWACDHWNLVPDILCTAKALSGGYVPVGAMLTKRWIHESVFSSLEKCSVQQSTFGMNDLAMVAGLATLHVLKHERLAQQSAEIGDYLIAQLRRRLSGYQMVKDIRGRGLMIAIEFGPPSTLGLRAGWSLLHKLDQSLFCQAILMPLMSDHRILAQVAGPKMDVIKFIPPLVLSRADADQIADALETTIAACHQFPGPAWEVGKKLGAAAIKRFGPRATGGREVELNGTATGG